MLRVYLLGEDQIKERESERTSIDQSQRTKSASTAKRKNNGKGKDLNNIGVVADGYESSDVLTVSGDMCSGECILDSGCSFHMTLNQECLIPTKRLMLERF